MKTLRIMFALLLLGMAGQAHALGSAKFTSLSATLGISTSALEVSGQTVLKNVSATNLDVSGTFTVGGSNTLQTNISTTSGGYVSATNLYGGSVSASTLTLAGQQAIVAIGTATVSTTSSSCNVTSYNGVYSGTCTRLGTGIYAISGTFPNSTYKVICFNTHVASGLNLGFMGNSNGAPNSTKTTDGHRVTVGVAAPGSPAFVDNVRFDCVAYSG
jgi:hypothetical protein